MWRKEITTYAIRLTACLLLVFAGLVAILLAFSLPVQDHLSGLFFSFLFFLVCNMLSFLGFIRIAERRPSFLTQFYLIQKIVRLLVCLVIILAYGLLLGRAVVAFSLEFFTFFLATIILESYSYIHIEAKIKNNR